MSIKSLSKFFTKASSTAIMLGLTSISALATGLYVYPSPILGQSYFNAIVTASCDPDIRQTIACELEGAIDDRLDVGEFARVVRGTDFMEKLAEKTSPVGTIEWTVFIPTDRALPTETWEALQDPENEDEAERFVKAHIVEGQIPPEAVVEEGSFTTLAGNLVEIEAKQKERIRLTGENGTSVVDTADSSNPGNGLIIKMDKAFVRPNL